jgi:hypothetical protein
MPSATDARRWWPLASAIAFQGAWLYLVLGAPVAGMLPLLAVHLWLTPTRAADVRRLWLVVPGIGADMLWQWAGLIRFLPDAAPWVPTWLVMLWLLFVLTLPHAQFYLLGLPAWGRALVGALVPLTYVGGYALGAATLPAGPWALVWMAPLWMLLLAFFCRAPVVHSQR